jgi:hypothetical protein
MVQRVKYYFLFMLILFVWNLFLNFVVNFIELDVELLTSIFKDKFQLSFVLELLSVFVSFSLKTLWFFFVNSWGFCHSRHCSYNYSINY